MEENTLTWTSILSVAAEIVTILVAAFSVILVVARPVKWIRRTLLASSLRRVLRRPKRWKLETSEVAFLLGCNERLPCWRCFRRRSLFIESLQEPAIRAVDGEGLLPADVLAAFNHRYTWPNPDINANAFALRSVLQSAATSRAQSLVGRILYPSDTDRLSELFLSIADLLERFAMAHPEGRMPASGSVEAGPDADRTVGDFADFSSALSGAIVLADSVEWRSRYATHVLSWHSRDFRHASNVKPNSTMSYNTTHERGRPCRLSHLVRDRKIGDFDRRVLSLRSVLPVSSSEFGWTGFILETNDTCYLTTEQGEGLRLADPTSDHEHDECTPLIGCKHLLPRSDAAQSPRISAANGHVRFGLDSDNPVTLVTTYVSILTRDNRLVLVRRSSSVRHGTNVVSATAGGVVEPDAEGSDGDVDQSGMPSVVACVQREAQEEIGLTLGAEQLRPVCVFLSNIRTSRPQGEADGLERRSGKGQLVAVVLFLAHVDLSFYGLKRQASKADPALGRFEVDELVAVKLTKDKEAFDLARYAYENAQQLDQHGLLSCLYAAAVLNGPSKARTEFTDAFRHRPWWLECNDRDKVRLVRDPRQLMHPNSGCTISGDPWELLGPSDWRDAWERLPSLLEEARTEMTTQSPS